MLVSEQSCQVEVAGTYRIEWNRSLGLVVQSSLIPFVFEPFLSKV